MNVLGLTDIETAVFLHLLKNGKSNAPAIIQALSFDKSTFYKVVKELSNKGLISISGSKRSQVYEARLQEFKKQKEDEYKNINITIEDLLKNYETGRFKDSNVQIFEGKTAYFDFMEETIRGDVKLIRNLDAGSAVNAIFTGGKDKYLKYLSSYIPKRLKKNIPIKIIVDSTVPNDQRDRTKPEKLKEARQFKKPLKFSCTLSTFGDRTGFLTLRNNTPWALIIKDPIITNVINVMFDVMWEVSTVR